MMMTSYEAPSYGGATTAATPGSYLDQHQQYAWQFATGLTGYHQRLQQHQYQQLQQQQQQQQFEQQRLQPPPTQHAVNAADHYYGNQYFNQSISQSIFRVA